MRTVLKFANNRNRGIFIWNSLAEEWVCLQKNTLFACIFWGLGLLQNKTEIRTALNVLIIEKIAR